MGMLPGKVLGPVQFVAASTQDNTAAAVATITVNKPTGTQDGDVMIAFLTRADGTGTWTGPAGWTEVADSSGVSIYHKTASSEGASYIFTPSQNRRVTGAILTFRAAAYAKVIAISTADTTNPITISSFTIDNADSTVIAFFAALNATSGTPSWSTPTSYTSVWNLTGSSACSQSISYRQTLSTSSGNIESTVSDTAQAETTAAVVIRPA